RSSWGARMASILLRVSILLRYASPDERAAKQLVALLEAAGHQVICADPAEPALGQTDKVLVLWSPASVASPYVYETARTALRSLVQVITPGLDVSDLAPVFRSKDVIPIADSERILEAVTTYVPREADEGEIGQALYSFGSRGRKV